MSTKTSSTPAAAPPSSSPTGLIIGILVAVVVAVGLIIAVLVTTGDDDSASTTIAPPDDGRQVPPALVGEVRPMEIDGDPLPPYQTAGDPAIGMVPPTLVGEDYTGFVNQISPDTADPTMVVFLAHWCPACNDEIPALIALDEQGLLPENLQVFGVMTGIAADRPNFPPSRWIANLDWPWAVVADDLDDAGRFVGADAYGLTGYPYIVMIDDGVVTDRWTGQLPSELLAARINAAVG